MLLLWIRRWPWHRRMGVRRHLAVVRVGQSDDPVACRRLQCGSRRYGRNGIVVRIWVVWADAGALQSERAFVNKSAHPPLHFQAAEYAYVELNSHGNVVGASRTDGIPGDL